MEVSKQIIQVFDELASRFGIVIDWGKENVLPYVRDLCGRYIKWEIVTSIVWLVVAVVFIVIAFRCKRNGKAAFLRYAQRTSYSTDDQVGFGWYALCTICLFIGVIMGFIHLFNIIQCVILPELPLYRFASSLLQ